VARPGSAAGSETGQGLLLVRREGLVDPGSDRADALGAVEGDGAIEIVRQAGGHPVARPDAASLTYVRAVSSEEWRRTHPPEGG
jgi:hypothetical protein